MDIRTVNSSHLDILAQPAPHFKVAPKPGDVIKEKKPIENRTREENVVFDAVKVVKAHVKGNRTAFTGFPANHNHPQRTGGGVFDQSPKKIKVQTKEGITGWKVLPPAVVGELQALNKQKKSNFSPSQKRKFESDKQAIVDKFIEDNKGPSSKDLQKVLISTCEEGDYHKSVSDYLASELGSKIWNVDQKITPKAKQLLGGSDKYVFDGSRQTYNLSVAVTESLDRTKLKTVWIAANMVDKIDGKVVGATILEENNKDQRKIFFEEVVAQTVLASNVLRDKKKFNIVYLPAKAEEISLHSELRVFRELIGRGVIGKGKNVKERLVDFGGSKANCLLCAHQILDGLKYIDFFKGTTKGAPLPKEFRLDKDAKESVNFHYHTQTVTPQSQTMVPGNFYSHFRREKITKIINEALEKSLENSTPFNQDLIKNYFKGLIEEPRLFAVENFQVPKLDKNEVNDLATAVQDINLKGTQKKVLNEEPIVNTKEIENKLRAVKNRFPANGNLSVENHKELQKALIDASGKGKVGDYKFQAQRDEKFSVDLQQEKSSSYALSAHQTIGNESSQKIPRSQMKKNANNRAVAKESNVTSNYFLRSQKLMATK